MQRVLKCGKVVKSRGKASKAQLVHYQEMLSNYIKDQGLKHTEQRWQISEVILLEGGHHSSQSIFQRVSDKYPDIGIATVYRSIELLCKAELIEESHTDVHGLKYYEVRTDSHHDHIQCVDCGEIFEFQNPKIERLQEQVCDQMRFDIQGHRHIITATCQLKKEKQAEC